MKKLFVLALASIFICNVQASNLFQSDNPFPQTQMQTMNNIYESTPSTIQDEVKKEKKSWFKRDKNLQQESTQLKLPQIPVYPVQHEGAQSNDSFYMFTTH